MTRDLNQGEAAREAAADWLARLQSDGVQERDWLAFQAWLEADPAHRDAYDAVEALWLEFGERADEVQAALSPAGKVVSLSARRRTPPWLGPALGFAVAAAAACVVWLAIPQSKPPVAPPAAERVFQTARGETREVRLEDGTRTSLSTASRISVAFDGRSRRVTMNDAEAAFDVAKDAARPFFVTVGDRTVRVVGTEFDIAHRDGRIAVTVRRGIVDVATAGETAPPVRLVPGQQLIREAGAAGQQVRNVAPDGAFAWREGRLVYDDATLEAIAADLSRYSETPIQVEERARSLRFSGVLAIGSPEAMVRRLQDLLPVSASNGSGSVVLRQRAAS